MSIPTLAASQASRHALTDRRCTHCRQLNPSETLFPCWEEAPFLSNRSALSCCFLSGLSLTSSEISSDTCSYPWEQAAHCYVNHRATLALCCLEAICRDRKGKRNLWRATNLGLVCENLQTLFLLGAAHNRKIDATSQV